MTSVSRPPRGSGLGWRSTPDDLYGREWVTIIVRHEASIDHPVPSRIGWS